MRAGYDSSLLNVVGVKSGNKKGRDELDQNK